MISFYISEQDLIGKMLQVNVSARYTAEEVLSHPWVLVRHTHTHTPMFLALISEGMSPPASHRLL